jgi:hypothetical protein
VQHSKTDRRRSEKGLFSRRPPERVVRSSSPAAENLHTSGSRPFRPYVSFHQLRTCRCTMIAHAGIPTKRVPLFVRVKRPFPHP